MFKFCEYLRGSVASLLPVNTPKVTDTVIALEDWNKWNRDSERVYGQSPKPAKKAYSAEDGTMYTSIGAKRVMLLVVVGIILGQEPVTAVRSFGYPGLVEYSPTGFNIRKDALVQGFNYGC